MHNFTYEKNGTRFVSLVLFMKKTLYRNCFTRKKCFHCECYVIKEIVVVSLKEKRKPKSSWMFIENSIMPSKLQVQYGKKRYH
jgi:hypothetical protein